MKARMFNALIILISFLASFSGQRALTKERSVFGATPTKRGTWLVCPNGASVNFQKLGNFGVNHTYFLYSEAYRKAYPLASGPLYSERWINYASNSTPPVQKIEVEILIGTSINKYTDKQINAILDKLLVAPANIKTSYKSFRVFDSPNDYGIGARSVRLRNSLGKIIEVRSTKHNWGNLKDASGKNIKFQSFTYRRGAMYCGPSRDAIHLRLLETLPLLATTEFGEEKKLPLVIMISDLYLNDQGSEEDVQIDF